MVSEGEHAIAKIRGERVSIEVTKVKKDFYKGCIEVTGVALEDHPNIGLVKNDVVTTTQNRLEDAPNG